ncbi:MAG: hypothetical protein ACKOX6_12770, partial [Bdellovibrio sp.]
MKKSVHRYSAIFMAGIFSASISFAEDATSSDGNAGAGNPSIVKALTDKAIAAKDAIVNYVNPADKAAQKKESESPGLDEKEQIIGNIITLNKMQVEGRILDKGITDIKSGSKEYDNHQADCVSRQNTAAKWCLETLSPNITDIVTGLNTMMSAVGGSSVNDSCSTFAKAMDLAKAGMTAYTAACGTTKAGCGYACVKARNGVEKVQKGLKEIGTCTSNDAVCLGMVESYNSLKRSTQDLIAKELDKADQKSVAGKAALCTGKYAQLAVSAIAGITSVANSLNQGKACDEATSAANVAAQTLEQKCAIETNAKLPECICLKNPMLEGCGSTAVKSTTSAEGFGSFASSGDKTLGKGNGLTNSD